MSAVGSMSVGDKQNTGSYDRALMSVMLCQLLQMAQMNSLFMRRFEILQNRHWILIIL